MSAPSSASSSASFLPTLSPHVLFPQTAPTPPPPPPPRTPTGLPAPPPARPRTSTGSSGVGGFAGPSPARPRTHLRIRGAWAEQAGYTPAGGNRGDVARPRTSPQQPSQQHWAASPAPSALMSSTGLMHSSQSIASPSHTLFVSPRSVATPASSSPRRSRSSAAAAPLSAECARAHALAHATHFQPFSKQAHIMQPTAAWATRMRELTEEQAIPIAPTTAALKPVPPATPRQQQQRSTPAPVTPQASPYAALIAESSPALAARKPGEGTWGDAAAPPASSLQRSSSVSAAPLPLPDDLDDLAPWERDLLLHLSRVSASHYDSGVPTALHPSPLEILWTLEHFKAAGVRFDRLQDAIAQAQKQKLAVRMFLNDPKQSQLIEDAQLIGSAAATPSKPDAEEKDNTASTPLAHTPLYAAAPSDRVDAIDLTLLFEQSRCADNVLHHLRSLQARGQRCAHILQLTALVLECERHFQERVADLWRFLSSARCFLFPLQEQADIVTRPAIHSLAKALPPSTLDQLRVRCWSWNEESRQSTRIRTEEALAEQAAAQQQLEARANEARSAKKQGGRHSNNAASSPLQVEGRQSKDAASTVAPTAPLVFHSLRDLVHRARVDEALDQRAAAAVPAPSPADPSTPLVSFLLSPHRLLSSTAQVRLRDLERLAHALYAEDVSELESRDDEESDGAESAATLVPDEGVISNYEQLLFHLRVLRENRVMQLRASGGGAQGNEEPVFGSFSELVQALHGEHQASLHRRAALRSFLIEESELFSTQSIASVGSLRSVKSASSILSDRSLMLLYFRAVRCGGKQLMHHLKQAIWSALPTTDDAATRQRKTAALSYRRADGQMLAVQLSSSAHGFVFATDVHALIRTVESQCTVFERLASELLAYLNQSSNILAPEAQQSCNFDAAKNVLLLADTGAHTLCYLREWAQQAASSSRADAASLVSLPFASLDDLVDALIAHHVSTVKRQLLRVLEEQHASICPALRSLSDVDLERVYSVARSSRRIYLLLSMIQAPPPAARIADGASVGANAWFDTDERPPTSYPSLSAFLAELSRLSTALREQMEAARAFLCQSSHPACALWTDGATAAEVKAQLQEDQEATLPLFEEARMDTLALLQSLNASASADSTYRFASIPALHQALVSAHAAREAARLPKRALLQGYLEHELCFVLRPFFAAKLKKRQAEAHRRDSARRSLSTDLPVIGPPLAETTPVDRSPSLTPRQLDGLLFACSDDAELGLALLRHLQDQRWAQFESVEALVHELARLYGRALAALEEIGARWSAWGLVPGESITSSLARRLILESGGACIDVYWVLDHFAAQGVAFKSLAERLTECARKWNELRMAKATIYCALVAEPSEQDALPLFVEGPSKARARLELQYQLEVLRRQAVEETEDAHRRAMAEVPLPPEESAVPTRPSQSHSSMVPRASHEGSVAEILLPQQLPAPTPAAAGSIAAGSLPPSAADFALDIEDEQPLQPLPEFDAPPFAVSVSDLHGLVMRYGFHTSFYLQALVEQRQATAQPAPMQSFAELAAAVERIHAAITASLFNFLIHSPDRSAAVTSSVSNADSGAASLHHQPSLATLEPVAIDSAASLPQSIAHTGITSAPFIPLLSASLLSSLALGQASASSPSARFSPSHPLLASLLSCAPELSPYVLCFHLSNLADPWRSNSPWMECYRRFVVSRSPTAAAGPGGPQAAQPTLPFNSWSELVQSLRELHQIWLSCRDSVLALLQHNIDEANQRAVALAATGVAPTGFVPFFPPHVQPLRLRDVDELIMHSHAGLLTSAWLRYYSQMLSQSAADACVQGLPPPLPLFASLADLQAQLGRDVFEVAQALTFARDRLRQLLVDSPAAPAPQQLQQQQQPQPSSHTLPLLSREAQSLLSAPALDEMFRIVVGGFQDARASLPLAPSSSEEQQTDADSIRDALAVVTPASMHDLNAQLHHLAHCGRQFSSLSSLLAALRFLVHRFRTRLLPELFLALNYLPGRALLCGFLSSSDLDQVLSMDGVERLVRDSNTGIYAAHIIRCWIEGVPTVGPQQGAAADAALASKQRSMKQWSGADDSTAITVGPFQTLDALIAALDTEFRTVLLPAMQTHQAEMLVHLQAVSGDLFGPSSGVVVDASAVAELFDRSGAWFDNLPLLRRFDEEMLRFPHFDAVAAHMIAVRGEEARAREELVKFLQDPRCALFAPPPWEEPAAAAEDATALDPTKRSPRRRQQGPAESSVNGSSSSSREATSQSTVSPITPRQVDRLLLELGGSSASQALQVLQDLSDRSARFASVVDLTLTLKDRARDAASKQQQVLESIGTLLSHTKLVGSGPEAAAIPLSHRTLKQLLKVSGNQADVCLSLIKSLNIQSLPVTAENAALLVAPPAPFATAAAAAASIKASGAGFGAPAGSSSATVDSSMSPAAKHLVSQLAVLHREVVDERDRMTEFFATATVVRPRAASASADGSAAATFSASAASAEQNGAEEAAEEAVGVTPAQLQLQAAQFSTDRCRVWKQLQAIEQALLASKASGSSRVATSSKQVRSLIARSALVPEVPVELAMGLIVVAGSSNRTMDLLLRLNRDEAFGFRSMSELTEALRNAYAQSLEQQRAVAQYLSSSSCTLLPREGLPASASSHPKSDASALSEAEPLTLARVLELLRAFGHGTLAAPQLLAYLQQLSGSRSDAAGSSSSEPRTAQFSSVSALSAHLCSFHRDLLAAQAHEVQSLLNAPECLLLRGPVLVPGTGEQVPACVVVSLRDAESLMRDSTAGIYTLVHLRALRERWFQCASLERLAAEVRVRVTWDGVEGVPMRGHAAAAAEQPVPVTPSVNSKQNQSCPTTPAAAPAPAPAEERELHSYLDASPLEQLQR